MDNGKIAIGGLVALGAIYAYSQQSQSDTSTSQRSQPESQSNSSQSGLSVSNDLISETRASEDEKQKEQPQETENTNQSSYETLTVVGSNRIDSNKEYSIDVSGDIDKKDVDYGDNVNNGFIVGKIQSGSDVWKVESGSDVSVEDLPVGASVKRGGREIYEETPVKEKNVKSDSGIVGDARIEDGEVVGTVSGISLTDDQKKAFRRLITPKSADYSTQDEFWLEYRINDSEEVRRLFKKFGIDEMLSREGYIIEGNEPDILVSESPFDENTMENIVKASKKILGKATYRILEQAPPEKNPLLRIANKYYRSQYANDTVINGYSLYNPFLPDSKARQLAKQAGDGKDDTFTGRFGYWGVE